jgi:hypothetical protein
MEKYAEIDEGVIGANLPQKSTKIMRYVFFAEI